MQFGRVSGREHHGGRRNRIGHHVLGSVRAAAAAAAAPTAPRRRPPPTERASAPPAPRRWTPRRRCDRPDAAGPTGQSDRQAVPDAELVLQRQRPLMGADPLLINCCILLPIRRVFDNVFIIRSNTAYSIRKLEIGGFHFKITLPD